MLLQNISKTDTSYKSGLKSLQKNDFFCIESMQFCRNLSSTGLHEQFNLLVLSKFKPKNHSSFYKFLLILSGDIELNPGPINFPCAVCGKGVRSKGVYCTNCGLWVHPRCESISDAKYKKMKKIPPNKYNYTCSKCLNENSDTVEVWDLLPFHNEVLDDSGSDNGLVDTGGINLSMMDDDKWLPFKKRGLHLLHLNINSLLSKIEELREMAKVTRAAIIGISESKLDDSVLDGEVNIEGYDIVRSDRNRHGGGVACYIRSDISFNVRTDFSADIENIFFDMLLPKLKPILVGIIYRPPDQSGFLEKLSSSIANANSFDSHEAYILGDFNINLNSKNLISNSSKRYKEFCSTHGLKQLIDSPTRVTEKTSSLLDHILTNAQDKISQSGVIDAGLSDHQITYCTRKVKKEKYYEHKDITIRSLKNYTQEAFVNALVEIDFPNYSQFTDVNVAYGDLISKTITVIDKLCPEKKVRIKGSNQDWFDNEVREAIRNRDSLFLKFKKTRSHGDNLSYKRAKNLAQRLIKRKKKDFVTGQLEQNIGKPKDLWKTLKSMGLSSKANSNTKICLKDGEKLSFDPKTNANTFCSFFSNLANDLLKKLPTPPKKFGMDTVKLYYQKQNYNNLNFQLNQTTEEIVLKLLQSINSSKAAGLDNLAGKFLKDGASILVTPITEICNLSIKLSTFPEKCKPAKLKPLFKKGSKTEAKNYRPISLLPLVSKIIEKVIHNQVESFLSNHSIIYKYQSGFRTKHSTNACLSYLSNKALKGFEDGNLTGMILIDLQKAFDTIDHEILLLKMNYLGFDKSTINWFRSYLADRTFIVNVNGEFSNPGKLTCGVPQGSILGPLLFLLYVNDMPQSVSCDLLLYADDSCLVFSDKNFDNIENELNTNFNSLCDWFVDNKLSIHFGEDKTKSILFGTKRKLKGLRKLDIRHGDVTIKQQPQVKYLGCVLDSSLTGESMALQALAKINGKLKFLYRKQSFLSASLRRLLCNALIQPHFDFACLAWYSCLNKKFKKKIQVAQNKCIRYCLYLDNRSHVGTKEFESVNWLPTKERFEQSVCVGIFNLFTGAAPAYISEMYLPAEQSQHTRRSLNKLQIPNQRTNRGLRTLSYAGPRLWNSLPNFLKSAGSVNNFKHKLKNLYFDNLKDKEKNPYFYY